MGISQCFVRISGVIFAQSTGMIKASKRVLVLVFFLVEIQTLTCQVISVKEGLTLRPIANASVLLLKDDVVLLTNDNGQLAASKLLGNNRVLISHPGFQIKSVEIDDLSKDYTIYLTERLTQIEEVKISANRWIQDQKDLSSQMVRIGSREVYFNNPQTSADMLNQTGQVFVQKSQQGGGSPVIRGFGANSLLIVMDGIRINNAIYRSGNLQNIISINPTILESTEVVFGPSSTHYGSDAMGGVMVFKTHAPGYSVGGKLEAHGSVFARYSSANNENTAALNVSVNNSRISDIFSFSISHFDDLRSGSYRPKGYSDFGKRIVYAARIDDKDTALINYDPNLQLGSAFNLYHAMNKLAYRINQDTELSYMVYYSTSGNIPRYDRLLRVNEEGRLQSAEWYYGPQFMLLNAIAINSTKVNWWFDQLRVIISNQIIEESRHDRSFQSSLLRHRIEQVDVYAMNADAQKQLGLDREFFYGIEALHNEVSSKAYQNDILTYEISPISTRYPAGGSRYSSLAIYGSYHQKTSQHLSFNAGARSTFTELSEEFLEPAIAQYPFDEIQQSNHSASGAAGIVVSPTSNIHSKFNFSTGFRAPNVDDLGKVFESDGTVVVPNKDLKPEYSLNYETGLEVVIKDRVKLETTLFYTDLINAMVRRPYSIEGTSEIFYDGQVYPMSALFNTGSAYIWGYYCGMNAEIGQYLGLLVRYNVVDGRDRAGNVPLRHVSPAFGKISMIYERKRLRSELVCLFQESKRLSDMSPDERAKTHLYTTDGALGWYTLSVRSNYRFSDHWSTSVGVENILDTHYRPYSSGISAAGRNGMLSVRYQL